MRRIYFFREGADPASLLAKNGVEDIGGKFAACTTKQSA
jgi:hypothetical protein